MRRLRQARLSALPALLPLLPLLASGAVAHPTDAQQARVMSGPSMAEILGAHNEARLRFSVPPLAWDHGLAQQALRCIEENRNRSFRHCESAYGENMYATTGTPEPADAVWSWMEEEADYEVARRRCRDFACGHFSQVVWSRTTRVGCAEGPGERGWTNVICNYDPPGNYGYMGNEAGDRDPSGRWFYFDPPPFTLAPTPPPSGPATRPGESPKSPSNPGASAAVEWTGLGPEVSDIEWDSPWMPDGEAWRSGPVPDGGRSSLSGRVRGPGTLTFRWRVSSEPGFDELGFWLDGVRPRPGISGEVGWQAVTVYVPEGTHQISWIYSKDEDTSQGADAGWIDRVAFRPSR